LKLMHLSGPVGGVILATLLPSASSYKVTEGVTP
jgi:hypothetical protein